VWCSYPRDVRNFLEVVSNANGIKRGVILTPSVDIGEAVAYSKERPIATTSSVGTDSSL